MKTLSLTDYIITKEGEIFNKRNGKKLKPQKNGKGYLRISIGGKLMFVHRLIAELYIPNPDNKPQVNHINGNKLDNRVENLEWVTNMENRKHALINLLHYQGEQCSWSKLNKEKVDFIRLHKELSNKELATLYGVSVGTIKDVRKYRTWK